MEIKNVWAVYFSGTGTTQKVATTLAKSLSQSLGAEYKEFSFNLPAARQEDLNFTADDLVVLGVPVYAGRVPNLLLPYIQNKVHGNGALAVPVVLYGNRNFDDGLMELRNVTRDNGFHPIAAAAIVGEHSFSTILGAGRPDEDDMALIQKLADQTADKVKALTEAPAEAVTVEGCDPIRPYYTPGTATASPLRISSRPSPSLTPTSASSAVYAPASVPWVPLILRTCPTWWASASSAVPA